MPTTTASVAPQAPALPQRPRISFAGGLRTAALVAAFALATVFLDWSIVPVIASVYALVRRDNSVVAEVAAAASLSWLLLIWRQMPNAAFAKLLSTLGDIFPVPGTVLIGISLALAAILASSAARLSLGLVGVRDSVEPRENR